VAAKQGQLSPFELRAKIARLNREAGSAPYDEARVMEDIDHAVRKMREWREWFDVEKGHVNDWDRLVQIAQHGASQMVGKRLGHMGTIDLFAAAQLARPGTLDLVSKAAGHFDGAVIDPVVAESEAIAFDRTHTSAMRLIDTAKAWEVVDSEHNELSAVIDLMRMGAVLDSDPDRELYSDVKTALILRPGYEPQLLIFEASPLGGPGRLVLAEKMVTFRGRRQGSSRVLLA
jgi:hypothetical protein